MRFSLTGDELRCIRTREQVIVYPGCFTSLYSSDGIYVFYSQKDNQSYLRSTISQEPPNGLAPLNISFNIPLSVNEIL